MLTPFAERGTVPVPIGMCSWQLLQGSGTCNSKLVILYDSDVIYKGYMVSLCELQSKIHLITADF